MDITIPIINYRVSLELLILIGVIYLIMAIHTVCGCCNMMRVKETMENMGAVVKKEIIEEKISDKEDEKKEGFVGANTNYGESSPFDINNDVPIDTANWMQPNLTVTPGQPLSKGVREILDRPQQPIPLPEGQMLMFANTPFKPECCPNTYSNSTGCACMTTGQYNYLITRGSNNVPYSEY